MYYNIQATNIYLLIILAETCAGFHFSDAPSSHEIFMIKTLQPFHQNLGVTIILNTHKDEVQCVFLRYVGIFLIWKTKIEFIIACITP